MRIVCLVAALSLAACGEVQPDAPEQPPIPRFEQLSPDPAEQGERLSHVLGCVGCHGLDLTGEDWTEPEMGVLWTANLTQSAQMFTEQELAAMITEGRRPDRALMDMPAFLFSGLNSEDLAAITAYLKTLEPKGDVHPDPSIGPELARQIEAGEFRDSAQHRAEMLDQLPTDMGEQHSYGRFIVRATCVECHGMDLRGGKQMADALPVDLRVIRLYSQEEFMTLLKTGKAQGDRELALMGGVARRRYAHFTPAEMQAVHAYLAAVAEHNQ